MSFEELVKNRRDCVEIIRKNDIEQGITHLLTGLYPDKTHFIYELLQNAEDTRAGEVYFALYADRLVCEHNGQRAFDMKDIRAITSIGSSTKRDDTTTIGKFGVGFKAVFAYTQTPSIHSGHWHFEIQDMMVPSKVPPPEGWDARVTRFIFPFDHPKKGAAAAFDEIRKGLAALNSSSLLFLEHIHTIRYDVFEADSGAPSQSGSLARTELEPHIVQVQQTATGQACAPEYFLQFSKQVSVLTEQSAEQLCTVAIAYGLIKHEPAAEQASTQKSKPNKALKSKSEHRWSVRALGNQANVCIYFPAEKETSKLNFHIHAPFASTVARDSVRDCAENNVLREHIALLVVDSLLVIRDRQLLDMEFLKVLPNAKDQLNDFYAPIHQAIVKAFQEQELTPTRSGTFKPSGALYRGPAEIAEVFDDEILGVLTNYESPYVDALLNFEKVLAKLRGEQPAQDSSLQVKNALQNSRLWAKNALQNSRADDFLSDLEIEEWGWGELNSQLFKIPYDSQKEAAFNSWLNQLSNKAIQKMYGVLLKCREKTQYRFPKKLNIIRCQSEPIEHLAADDEVYIKGELDEMPAGVHCVHPEVCEDETAKNFLRTIGVKEYDIHTVIELELQKTPASIEESILAVTKYIQYLKEHPNKSGAFTRSKFLMSADQKPTAPANLCIDHSLCSTGLGLIQGYRLINEAYFTQIKHTKNLVEFLKLVGVRDELVIIESSVDTIDDKDVRSQLIGPPRIITHKKIDSDRTIDGLDQILQVRNVSVSLLLWNTLIKAQPHCAKARYRPSEAKPIKEADSTLVRKLKASAWIPTREGEYKKPCDMTHAELRDDFVYDDRNGLLSAIGFGATAQQRSEEYQAKELSAKAFGFEGLDQLKDVQELIKYVPAAKIRELTAQFKQPTELPINNVNNPTRRADRVGAAARNAPAAQKESKMRSVSKGASEDTAQAKAYLRACYTAENGDLVCQICQESMPFKVNGKYYFEAVQVVRGLQWRHPENRLALCPLCAAKYQHALETPREHITQAIGAYDQDGQESFELPIRLADEQMTVYWVGKHIFDLHTIFENEPAQADVDVDDDEDDVADVEYGDESGFA